MDKKNSGGNLNTFIMGGVSSESEGKKICHYKNIPFLIEIYKSVNAYKNIIGESALVSPSINRTGNTLSFLFDNDSITNVNEFISCIKKHSPKTSIQTTEKKKIIAKIKIPN